MLARRRGHRQILALGLNLAFMLVDGGALTLRKRVAATMSAIRAAKIGVTGRPVTIGIKRKNQNITMISGIVRITSTKMPVGTRIHRFDDRRSIAQSVPVMRLALMPANASTKGQAEPSQHVGQVAGHHRKIHGCLTLPVHRC